MRLPSGPVKAMRITRNNGTTRNAIRKSAMPASTKTCIGLAPKRAVSDRGGGDIVVREDTGPDDNHRIGLRKPLDLWPGVSGLRGRPSKTLGQQWL